MKNSRLFTMRGISMRGISMRGISMRGISMLGISMLGILALLAATPLTPTASAAPTTHRITGIDVPAAAKATLARLYPGVKNAKWEKEDGNYEVGFKNQGKQLSLVIDAKGTVLETETTIATSALPESVRAYVSQHHRGKSIKEAAEIVDAKGRKRYEAEVGGKDLLFDEKGAFIK